jgi:hypothetical protein
MAISDQVLALFKNVPCKKGEYAHHCKPAPPLWNSETLCTFGLTKIRTGGKDFTSWARLNDRHAPTVGRLWFWRYLPAAKESARSSVSTATGPIH